MIDEDSEIVTEVKITPANSAVLKWQRDACRLNILSKQSEGLETYHA